LIRNVVQSNAMKPNSRLVSQKVSAIITSPPYMNSLSYARDNRLRLWFLGVEDHTILEPVLSPHKMQFLSMMEALMNLWSKLLVRNGVCILVLGAVHRNGKYYHLPEELLKITSHKLCHLKPTAICKNAIPDIRRARVNCCSTREETIIVLRKRN
jgi:tRNA G10  N-methylase Trm11